MPANPIDSFIQKQNAKRKTLNLLISTSKLVLSFFAFISVFSALEVVTDDQTLINMILGIVASTLVVFFYRPKLLKKVEKKPLYKLLETKYSDTPVPPSSLEKNIDSKNALVWNEKLEREEEEFTSFNKSQVKKSGIVSPSI